jgi:hypothetical protein
MGYTTGTELPPDDSSNPQPPPSTPALVPNHPMTPWEPVIDSNSTQDEINAAAQYTAVYGGSPLSSAPADSGPSMLASYNIPDLAMSYTKAIHLMAVPQDGGSGGSPPVPWGVIDSYPLVHIDLAALLDTEQTCLNMTSDTIDAYNTLRSAVTNATTSDVFGQYCGYQRFNMGASAVTVTYYDQFDKEAIKFAAAVIPQIEYLMQTIGGIVEIMGTFAALLNNAGQMYSYTDRSAAFD